MKRSRIERRTPLRGRTPLRRVTVRRERELEQLRDAQVVVARRSGGRCEAVAIPHDCLGRADTFHHVQPRTRRNHVPENLLHCCYLAHRAIHDQPTLAREVGYLRSRISHRLP